MRCDELVIIELDESYPMAEILLVAEELSVRGFTVEMRPCIRLADGEEIWYLIAESKKIVDFHVGHHQE